MKRVIRRGVFETNSSSVHSITMCSENEWNEWKQGELVWDYYTEKLIPVNNDVEADNERYYSYEDWFDGYWFRDEFEKYDDKYTLPNGEVIHAFGYYGHD